MSLRAVRNSLLILGCVLVSTRPLDRVRYKIYRYDKDIFWDQATYIISPLSFAGRFIVLAGRQHRGGHLVVGAEYLRTVLGTR